MAIFRCKKCEYIQEIPDKNIDKIFNCPKCQTENKVHKSLALIEQIIVNYRKKQKEVSEYKNEIIKIKELNASLKIEYQKNIEKLNHTITDLENKILNPLVLDNKNISDTISPNVKNISHQEEFVQNDDYQDMNIWFKNKNIDIKIDMNAIDTKGFFDEVAISIGNNFTTLEPVLKQIRYIQRKNYETVKINLKNNTKEEISIIKNFSKEIYNYSFISRFYYDKNQNSIYLNLQQASKIRNFFNGSWLEWYLYMMLLDFFDKKNLDYKIVRSLEIKHKNNSKNELDIFFIADNIPICIECKSGEFRGDINKYLQTKKRLKLEKEQFVLCVIGLDDIKADGLTNTYDITFCNQNNLLEHIGNIFK